MMFTEDQKAELAKPLNRIHVKTREQGKSTLSYIESWHAIAEANRIFGFDAWDSHTVECRCVAEHERKIGRGQYERDGWGVTYIAKVCVKVGGIEREGMGSGHGIDVDLGLAHESAIKEAESDARKRALMTFGNQFGLALYDKAQANVSDGIEEPASKPAQKPRKPRASGERLTDTKDIEHVYAALYENMQRLLTKGDLLKWAGNQKTQIESLPDNEYYAFKDAFADRLSRLPESTLDAA